MTPGPTAVALTIAGSDSGGGAGIQADLATFAALGVFGTCAVTALTAQNLSVVSGVAASDPEVVRGQIDAVLSGFDVRAVKTGMLASSEIVEVVAATLAERGVRNLVVDPVVTAARGDGRSGPVRLLDEDALEPCLQRLIPLATLVTPNAAELEALTGRPARTVAQAIEAAKALRDRTGAAVLVKAGHLPGAADDQLVTRDRVIAFPGERVAGVETHGVGCMLSAAIAALLARGTGLVEAVGEARRFVAEAFAHPLVIGLRTVVLGSSAAYRGPAAGTEPAESARAEGMAK